MRSDLDPVCRGVLGLERPVRSARALGSGGRVLVVLVVLLCAWVGLAGAARAAAPGTISTVAGNGTRGSTGNGGPATSAEVNGAYGVVADAGGDLVIADTYDYMVRLVAGSNCTSACPYGLAAMTKGDIYVVAGTGVAGSTGDGGPARSAELSFPWGLALDPQGDLLISDLNTSNVVRLVARASCATACPYGLRSMVLGDIYTIAGDHAAGYSGDGGPATSAELYDPFGLAVDQAGNLAISDAQNQRVRLVADSSCSTACPYGLPSMTVGFIYTIAGDGASGDTGDGGPATAAELHSPQGLAFDGVGDLLIANPGSSSVRLVAETSCAFDCQYGLRSMTPGDIYTVAGKGTPGYSGDGKPATSTELDGPSAVAVDGVGDLLIADTDNSRIRIVPDIGCTSACPYGLPALHKGFMYTVAGNGTAGFSGDGGPAASAEIDEPSAVTVDGGSNLLFSDFDNFRIRLVTASEPPPVCYETGARMVGQDGFTGTSDQEDVIVYAPAGLASITGVTVVNGTASHPAFAPGTKRGVIVTATQTVQTMPVSGYYKATDEDGRTTYCGFSLPAG